MKKIEVGEWLVDPESGRVVRNGKAVQLDIRSMRVLLCLAERAGETVSTEELLKKAWPEVSVSAQSVYQAVTTLRRILGDDTKVPSYIATVPRLGYRMIARVNLSPGNASTVLKKSKVVRGVVIGLAGGVAACLAVGGVVLFRGRTHGAEAQAATVETQKTASVEPQKSVAPTASAEVAAEATTAGQSVAVLPFLDLTEGMKEETFADGMTEEIIDKLSAVPGFKVPGANSSFYFKGKQMTTAEIATKLGVEFVVDGSVRKSGSQVRVATRLVRADNGYVVWSETYDRPFRDLLKVQDEIANEVAKKLQPVAR